MVANSGPHVCTASTLPTEPSSPQLSSTFPSSLRRDPGCVYEAGLKILIFLFTNPQCWDGKYTLLHLAASLFPLKILFTYYLIILFSNDHIYLKFLTSPSSHPNSGLLTFITSSSSLLVFASRSSVTNASCLPACSICLPMCSVPVEMGRGHWVFWNWHYRWLWATMCMLRPKPGSSSRASSTLNC